MTPGETFELRVCAEEPDDGETESRCVVEMIGRDGGLVTLVEPFSGLDTRALGDRARVEPSDAVLAALREWNAPGCRVEFTEA